MRTGHREAVVTVVVSISRGHDESYPCKTIGAAGGQDIIGERGAGYHLSSVEKGGEPAGTLSATAGQVGFQRDGKRWAGDFEPLHRRFLDPRNLAGRCARREYRGNPSAAQASASRAGIVPPTIGGT